MSPTSSTPRVPASHLGSARLAGTLLMALAPPVLLAAAALGQRQFEPLVYLPLPEDDDSSEDVAFGDVDADGDLDLVFASLEDPHRLYLNDGTGKFSDATAARMPASSDLAYSTAMGDVDGDGDLDLVFGHFGQNRLYLNDGTGRFTDVTAARMPPDPFVSEDVAMGDVDGDGDLDLVFAHRHGSGSGAQNALYLNDGSGSFTDATAGRMPTGSEFSTAVVMADVDGDGDLDVVFANGVLRREQNRLYINDGSGTFSDETTLRMPIATDWSRAVASGDVDGDGDPDLVFGNGQQNRLYLNDGLGRYADVTAVRMPLDNDSTTAVVLGDVDGDRDPDLIWGITSGNHAGKLYLNDGTGTFSDVTSTHMPAFLEPPNAAALGDVDGDGDDDVVFADGFSFSGNQLFQNRLFTNDGTGVFVDPTIHRMPLETDRTAAVAVGDVDGNGDADLVFGNYGVPERRQNRLYLNNGDGFFEDGTAGQMPVDFDQTRAVAFGDLDGDGDLDLVVGNGGANRLYLNDGTGRFSDVTAGRLPEHDDLTEDVVLGDVDGDGDLDLVCANFRPDPDRLYLNDGTGVFRDASASLPSPFADVVGMAFGDVDGDGDLDLIGAQYRVLPSAPSTLWLNDGTGRFTDVTAQQMPSADSSAWEVVFGDVDGDGDGDIVLAENETYWLSGRNKLYLNDGRGFFTDVTATHMPAVAEPAVAVAMGDVDGDGDEDLVFTNLYAQSDLFLNDGSGTFSAVTSARMPAIPSSEEVALGDVDRDGDLDLILTNDGQPNRLYLNVLRQLDTPYPVLEPGSEYQVDVYDRYGNAGAQDHAYPLLSTASANIPLAPFGSLLISPLGMVALPAVPIPQPSGVGSISLTVPNVPGVIGVSLHAQALIVQVARARLTNATFDRIR